MDLILETAKRALKAWEKGEHSGDYEDFKALLSPQFRFFAHPLAEGGTARGATAREKMQDLISGREKNSNKLSFSNPTFARGEDLGGEPTVVVEFDSEGTLAGGTQIKGRNAITFGIDDGQVVGFREYFGLVDPAWFR